MINQIKGAIFDMDGTLVDSLMVWEVLWRSFGQRFLQDETFHPTAEEDKAVRTMTLKDAMDYIHSIYGIGSGGKELLDAANEILVDFYKNDVQLKKGVIPFLNACREKGIKMCIASATAPKMLEKAVECCGLAEYFPKVFSCGAIGKGKDQPDIYLLAMKELGTSLEETCVFEDSHVAINTAHQIGMKTVGIYDRYNYGQEEMQKTADVYIAEGETLEKLLG